ncbi:MAG TPA: pyridoxal-dependent decarboxylase [Streptosporangiaceae bacterium]|nr:pyridoxal-dependent decarboxylase [Streptosporangiaceae bacterium]
MNSGSAMQDELIAEQVNTGLVKQGAWDVEEFARAATIAVERLGAYVDKSQRGENPVVVRRPPRELAERLELERWIREGGMTPETFEKFLAVYLANGTQLHHPGYLAHQTAVPDFPAALAEFVHGAMNNPMDIYEMGAAAVVVEVEVTRWMLTKVGWDPDTGGAILTHGGSLANLTALLAARAAAAPSAWTDGVPGDLAVLAPCSSHYSIARAAAMMGLGERSVIPLDTDELERIIPERIPVAVERARRAGRRPMALVANACATGTGLYDDLRRIGEHCREHGIWLHVDSAHGASALLAMEHRHLLDGIELADSMVWDAHKMLRTPSLAAGVLLRRGEDLDRAFHQEASYLFYGDRSQGIDLITRTVECTKAELGLKIFCNLAWRGEGGLGAYVSGQYATAHRFWELARERPGFECPYEPQTNIVCFRRGCSDDAQIAIREYLMKEGTFHLSSTQIAGSRYLRLTVMAPATDEETLHRLLDAIDRASRASREVGRPGD